MNWLATLAVLVLTFQHDAALTTSSKNLWADPDKASSLMNCLITKIGESENFPQEVKEDLESIMDTLMSGISGVNAKGKNSGLRIQAMNMAIASSLAEIVVADDEENPKDIAAKTQDLVGGLEQCFESVMGTIDKKFIGKINDLISMFTKEAASAIENVKDQEDPSSSSSTETARKSTEQPTLTEDGDEVSESEPIKDEIQDPKTAPSDVDPQFSKPEPNSVESQDSQTSPKPITGPTNELVNTSISEVVLKKGIPQQIIQTAVYPNSSPSSSYRSTSMSSANTHQSSHTIRGSSETASGVLSGNRRPEFFESLATASGPQASKSIQNDFVPQVTREAPGVISSEAKKLVDPSTWRTFQGNRVPQQTVSRFGYPKRLHSSLTETTRQSADILKSISTSQESSQTERGYAGTYSGSKLSKTSPIDGELRTSQAAPGFVSKTVNKQGDTSTLRVVNEQEDTSTQRVVNEQDNTSPLIGVAQRSGVLQQTQPTTGNLKGSSSSSQTSSQSADNTYQSNQILKDRRYGMRNRRPEFFKTSAIAAGPQVLKSTQNGVGSTTTQPTSGHVWTVENKLVDTSSWIGSTRNRIPQQTIPTAEYQSRSSSPYETAGQSSTNNYQSSEKYEGSTQTAGGYGRRNHGLEFPEHPVITAGLKTPKFAKNNVGLQALRGKPGFISRETNKLEDTSSRRVFMRKGAPQQTFPAADFINTPSSSFSRTSQFSDNSNESSQTTQGSSQTARGYGGIIRRPDIFESPVTVSGPQASKATQNNFESQISQAVPGLLTGVADKQADTTTRTTGLRNGVPKQTVYSNKASYQASNSDDKSYQTSQAFQGSILRTDGYLRRYHKPQFETTAIDTGSKALPSAPGLVSRVVNGHGNTSTQRAVNDQGYTSTQRVVNDQRTLKVVNDQEKTSIQRVVNEQGDTSTQRVVNDQGDTSTQRVVNDQGNTSTRIGVVLRGGATQQATTNSVYPKRPYPSLFQAASQSAVNTYQSSQAFQGSSEITGGYAYSGPQTSQSARIGDGNQFPQAAPGFGSSPGSQDTFNDKSSNDQWRELSVVSTLNSSIGLRSNSASARISQMISTVLNAVGPNDIDANALTHSLQESVLNIRSSGMSSSDAKLEVLLELIVGLLQIVSSAQVQEINPNAAPDLTNAVVRCFEIAFA